MFGLPARVEDLSAGELMIRPPVPLDPGELPSSYGTNRLVLLPVDPYLIYTYWELADDPPPTAGSRAVLRFHESPVNSSPHVSRPFDVDIDLGAGNWYVHLWSPDKFYQAHLGLRGEDGAFVILAQSNLVRTPPARPKDPEPAAESKPAPAPIPAPIPQPIPQPIEDQAPDPAPVKTTALRYKTLEEVFAASVTDFSPSVPRELEPVATYISNPTPTPTPTPTLTPTPSAIPIPVPFQLDDLEKMDLTQYSEERFTPGISSEGGPLGE
jgi:Domain of unknown function (DUF4912)